LVIQLARWQISSEKSSFQIRSKFPATKRLEVFHSIFEDMNFLPMLVFVSLFFDGSIFWHGDGLSRHAYPDDFGAVSAFPQEKTQATGRFGQQRSDRAVSSVSGP
jgi:hypothetical protein